MSRKRSVVKAATPIVGVTQKSTEEVGMKNDVNYISVDSTLIKYVGYLESLKFKNHIFKKDVPTYIPKDLAEHIMARSYLGTQFEIVKEDKIEPLVDFVPENVEEGERGN